MVTEKREYLTLEKSTIWGGRTVNINTKETKDLGLVRDMIEKRHTGTMDSQTKIGINNTNENTQLVLVKSEAYSKKISFPAQVNYHRESPHGKYSEGQA